MAHPQIEALLRQLSDATARAERLAGAATPQKLAARPSPTSWSAAECLAHLTLTTDAYLPLLDAALAAAPPGTVAHDHRYAPGFIGGLLAWSLEPPYRMKTKTGPSFVPGPPADANAVLAQFLAGQAELKQRLIACDGKDLNRMMVRSPFNQKLRYNVYAALLSLLAHQRRHLWQAEQTVEKLEVRS